MHLRTRWFLNQTLVFRNEMRIPMMIEPLREEQRKEVFRTLVELQDEGCAAEQSRIQVAAQFSINVREVQDVEREGITKQWAPL